MGQYSTDGIAFMRRLKRCGAVDVREADGGTRCGIIRDLVPGQGVVVDFHYRNHRADLVPFGECIRLYEETEAGWHEGKMDALYQRFPGEPWRWYPAKCLSWGEAAGMEHYHFVNIRVEYETKQEVMLDRMIRTATAPQAQLQAAFVRRVTKTLSPAAREYKVRAALEHSGKGAKNKESSTLTQSAPRIMESCGQFVVTTKSCHPESADKFSMHLPLDLLAEVLSLHCYVNDLAGLQRVCRRWDHILTANRWLLHVRVKCDEPGYRLAAILHKSVSKSTKTLVMDGRTCGRYDYDGMFTTVTSVCRAKSIKVPVLICTTMDLWPREFEKYCATWKDICDTLIVHKIRVAMNVKRNGRSSISMGLRIPKEVVRSGQEMSLDAAFGKWNQDPAMSKENLGILENQLRMVWERCEEGREKILEILWQNDRRSRSHVVTSMPEFSTLGKIAVWALAHGNCDREYRQHLKKRKYVDTEG